MYDRPKDSLIVDKVPASLKVKPIGEGSYGKCYLCEDGKHAYKEFHQKKQLYEEEIYNIKAFTYLENDSVSFPRTIVYNLFLNDESIIGYIMNYFNAIQSMNISDEERMKDIINASYLLEKEICYLSNQGVLIKDLHDENVLYTIDKLFKLSDTDLYGLSVSEEPKIILKENLKAWGDFLFSMVGNAYPYDNAKLNNSYYQLVMYGRDRASRVLELTVDYMRKELNHDIETLGDFKDSMEILKKLK